jgi:small subunit ribosomal protein S9
MIEKNITVSGKRKTAVAKATIRKGNGKITINNIPYENLDMFKKLMISEPIQLTKDTLGKFDFDISVTAKGGGSESQTAAARLAIAKAIIEFSKSEELKKIFLRYDKALLVADTRRKEAYKPGDSKARAKRQKSFR